jgi:hypothetical protein
LREERVDKRWENNARFSRQDGVGHRVQLGGAIVDDDQPSAVFHRAHRNACCRPHGEGRADREAGIAMAGFLHRVVDILDDEALPEADRRRLEEFPTQLAVGIVISLADAVENARDRQSAAATQAYDLSRRAMQLDDVLRSGQLMQPVDVLRHDDGRSPRVLQPGHCLMSRVGTGDVDRGLQAVAPAFATYVSVGKVVLDRVPGRVSGSPHTLRTPEVGDTRLGRDARSAEYEDPAGAAKPAQRRLQVKLGQYCSFYLFIVPSTPAAVATASCRLARRE